jgi:hypothetical protein
MLRHPRSQSNLQQNGRFEPPFEDIMAPSPSLSTVPTRETAPLDDITGGGTSTTAGGVGRKRRMNIVRGVSVQAERFARSLDSALDFIDGRVGFGTV